VVAGAESMERSANGVSMGRMGTPDEVADVVTFLFGDESRYMVSKYSPSNCRVSGNGALETCSGICPQRLCTLQAHKTSVEIHTNLRTEWECCGDYRWHTEGMMCVGTRK
jgi:hypothetical protein